MHPPVSVATGCEARPGLSAIRRPSPPVQVRLLREPPLHWSAHRGSVPRRHPSLPLYINWR